MTQSAVGLTRRAGSLTSTAPAMVFVLALSAPALAARQAERAIVELIINEAARGEIEILLDKDEIWIPVDALRAAGLQRLGGRRLRTDDRDLVAVASLTPDATAVFDERALTLRLTVVPALFPQTTVAIEAAHPTDIEYTRAPGAFVNYAAVWRPDSGTDAFAEAALQVGPAVFETQATRLSANRRVVLGLTSLTVDERRAMRRWTLGDFAVPGSALRTGFLAGGISVAREYSLDPYYDPSPTPAFSGMVATPSTVEVYVNDQLVKRDMLPSGPFEIRQLPLTTGLGHTRVVVRDAFGRMSEFGAQYYRPSAALKRGAVEYRYALGARRSSSTTAPLQYSQLAATVVSRVGVTDWLTVGVDAEGDRFTGDGGPTVSLRIWKLGEVEVAGAASVGTGAPGRAGYASYAFITRTFSVSAMARVRSRSFATIAEAPPGAPCSRPPAL